MLKYNSITAREQFLARTAQGGTVTVRAGETLRLQDARDSDSGQVVHFALPTGELVTAISAAPGAPTPWRLNRS